jgi:zinc D-Ala-D-Ala carboxypeptidase
MGKPVFSWSVFSWLLPCALAAVHFPVHAHPIGLKVNFIAESNSPADLHDAREDSGRLFPAGRVGTAGARRDRLPPGAPAPVAAAPGNEKILPAVKPGAIARNGGPMVFRGMAALLSWLRNKSFARQIAWLHRMLGIPATYAHLHGLPLHPEARGLVSVGPDIYRRDQRLLPPAAAAWRAMAAAAAADGVELQLVSAFRPVDYQAVILRRKLDQGQPIDDVLRMSAAPGYSEHHSGRAVDLTAPGYPVLEVEFERSAAFAWLGRRAAEFGFRMSYPRGNSHGVSYEPWHWTWRGTANNAYAAWAPR